MQTLMYCLGLFFLFGVGFRFVVKFKEENVNEQKL